VIKAIIIDDERSGRQVLRQMLEQFCKNVEVTAAVDSADEGRKAISKYRPDVVFLDIEMPFENGFEMLENIGNRDFNVVFVTAHGVYAERAKKYNPLQFLLKPINISELRHALAKVERLAQ
jgi:two-component system LytT family response regulator